MALNILDFNTSSKTTKIDENLTIRRSFYREGQLCEILVCEAIAILGSRTTFTKYQQFIRNCFALMPRQALHAKSLGFKHPITGKEILFESELPEDFAAVVEKWRGYSKNETL